MTPSEQAIDPLIGRTLEGRYRVVAPLGRGAMGVVYRVEHVTLKKEFALKLLHQELGGSEELQRRFEREAEAAARLSHANIIAVTDFGRTEDGRLYLVMELLDGPPLTHALHDAGGPLGIARSLRIARQILRALQHAHLAGVVHRDLKPDNIVLLNVRDGEADVVKILDFGIAKISAGKGGREETLTQVGMIYGTPEYLSPEQALGEPADARADLYAVAVILYEMLVGRRPFESESKLALVSMHITEKAIPVIDAAQITPVPRWLSDVVEHAMQKPREARYQDAASFLEALDGENSSPRTGRAVTLGARTRRVVLGMADSLTRALRERNTPAPRLVAWGLIMVSAVLFFSALAIALRTPTPQPIAPDHARAAHLLKTGRTCKDRRAAALELIAAGDRHFLGDLEAARDRRSGLFGLEHANACMQKELEAGISRLREGAP